MSSPSPRDIHQRRARPPRAARRTTVLGRDEVLERAVRMADEVGVEGVTMRALADSLGVSAMSLYAHVTDKDDILDAVIEERLRTAGLPDIERPWQEWMSVIAHDLRSMLVAEPALLDRYSRRPVAVPSALARMDAALDVLTGAGFADTAAVAAFAAVHTYTIGFAALEAARRAPAGRTRRIPATLDDTHPGYWPAYFATDESEHYRQLARIRPDLVAFTDDEQFGAGLTALIDGLDHRYRPAAANKRGRR